MRRVPRSLRFVVALSLALAVTAVPGTPSAADGLKAGCAPSVEGGGRNEPGRRCSTG